MTKYINCDYTKVFLYNKLNTQLSEAELIQLWVWEQRRYCNNDQIVCTIVWCTSILGIAHIVTIHFKQADAYA